MVGVLVLVDAGCDELSVLVPPQAALIVYLDEVVLTLLATEIADLFSVELFTAAKWQIQVSPRAVVEPVEEILGGVLPLPILMIDLEVGAVPMLLVHHLQEVPEVHEH